MSAPEVAADHYARRQRLVDATGEAAARAWAQVDPARIADSWAAQVPEMTVVVSGAQLAAARPADTYTDAVLDDLDVDAESLGDVDPSGFSGRASDGRSLQGLLANPAIVALMAIQDGADVARALASGRANLDMLVRTQVADAGRLADQVAITARPKAAGYVRMAVGNSCARCLILSGRFYRWNTGFQRHPRCDCVHIPSGQLQVARVKLSSPEETYARMTAGQRTAAGFSLADQEAIALGSDLNQVVNARRGLFTAGGRKFTHVNARVAPRGARMSVDQIFRDATGRDDAIRLLQRHGYLTSAPVARQVPRTLDERFAAAATDRAALRAAPANAGRRETGNVAVTRSEQAALRDYISNFFVAINGNLRRQTVSQFLQRTVDRLDAVMTRATLRRDVLVWRGMQDAGRLFGDRLGGNLTGFEWRELGYVSTSANPAVARQFMVDNGDRVLMRVLVPRGTQAVQLSPWSEFAFESQSELLLRRGLRLRVVRDRGVSPQGYRLVDVEVVLG